MQAQIEAMQDGIRKATPEHLDAMMRQVSSLKKLTQDLVDLAQADAQQLKCYLSSVNRLGSYNKKSKISDLNSNKQG